MRNWGFLPTFKDYLKGDKEFPPEALIQNNFATRDFFFLKK